MNIEEGRSNRPLTPSGGSSDKSDSGGRCVLAGGRGGPEGFEASAATRLAPPLVLASGGILFCTAYAGRYLGLLGATHQNVLMILGLIGIFAPAVAALTRNLGRPITRNMGLCGVVCLLIHVALNVGDGISALNHYWLFNDGNAVHIVAQEVFSAAAYTLLAGALYYYIVLCRTSEMSLARERDRLKAEVTERKLAQEALHLQSEAIRQALDGIAIADLDGIVQFVNPAWAHMHGYSPEEVKGKHLGLFHAPEQMQREVLPILRTLREKGYYLGEVGHARRNGSTFQTRMSVSTVRDEHNAPVCTIGIARDITKEQKLEAQLRHSQKMDAVGVFAGGIAHNQKNHIASILGWLEIARNNLGDANMVRSCLEHATATGEKASDQIGRILTFSRVKESRREPMRIAVAVEEGLRLLKGMLPSTIGLREELNPVYVLVLADSDSIHQILMNLGTNAFDAMRERGGTLTVSLDEIDIGAEQASSYLRLTPGKHVRLRVSDTGHGMTPETIENIFDPFFTTKGPSAGTGLGLSVVHGIVESIGGVIDVDSTVGEGTTFTILFPVYAAVPAQV